MVFPILFNSFFDSSLILFVEFVLNLIARNRTVCQEVELFFAVNLSIVGRDYIVISEKLGRLLLFSHWCWSQKPTIILIASALEIPCIILLCFLGLN